MRYIYMKKKDIKNYVRSPLLADTLAGLVYDFPLGLNKFTLYTRGCLSIYIMYSYTIILSRPHTVIKTTGYCVPYRNIRNICFATV